MGVSVKIGLDSYLEPCKEHNMHKLMRSLFGFEGESISHSLLREIFSHYGYYMKWDSKYMKMFARNGGYHIKKVQDVVTECLFQGFFDEDKFTSYGILTSLEIQQKWFNVVRERREIIENASYVFERIQISINEYREIRSLKKNSQDSDNQNNFPFSSPEQNPDILRSSSEQKPNNAETHEDFKDKEGRKEVSKQESKQENFSDLPTSFLSNKVEYVGGEGVVSSEAEANNFSNQKNESEVVTDIKTEPTTEQKNAPGGAEKTVKEKQEKHPCRDDIVSAWEQKFGNPYVQNFAGNIAIKQVTEALDKKIRLDMSRGGITITTSDLYNHIIILWKGILDNWELYKAFLQNKTDFVRIANYFNEVLQEYDRVVEATEPVKKKPPKRPKQKKAPISPTEDDGEYQEAQVYPTFEDFWEAYEKKVGRAKAEPKWDKLKQSEKEAIMEFIPKYKQAQPEKQYRQHPETFLNKKTWNDELIYKTNTGNTKENDRRAGIANYFAAKHRQ